MNKTGRFPTLFDVIGDISHMPQYVVALQHIAQGVHAGRWIALHHYGEDDSLEQARQAYDSGYVEMIQGRGVDRMGRIWQIQYAIPRRRQREDHQRYFNTRRAA